MLHTLGRSSLIRQRTRHRPHVRTTGQRLQTCGKKHLLRETRSNLLRRSATFGQRRHPVRRKTGRNHRRKRVGTTRLHRRFITNQRRGPLKRAVLLRHSASRGLLSHTKTRVELRIAVRTRTRTRSRPEADNLSPYQASSRIAGWLFRLVVSFRLLRSVQRWCERLLDSEVLESQ